MSEMPIFRVKSVKIYTGQKNLHWRRQPRQRQLSGMQTFTKNPKLRLKPDSYLPLVTQTETRIYFPPADATCGLDWTNIIFLHISWDQTGLISRALRETMKVDRYCLKLCRIFPQTGQNISSKWAEYCPKWLFPFFGKNTHFYLTGHKWPFNEFWLHCQISH